ncbi:MAG: hypothetical protein AAB426_15055, partial [Myxococcota bacterium]
TLSGGTTQTTLRVTTNEAATCKWTTVPGTAYAAMATPFTTTGTTSHNTVVTGLADSQSYTYYVRCEDGAGNATTSDFVVSFGVGAGPGPLAVSLEPSRISGVAPLSVFFDATGTTATAVTSRPFHDLEYRWGFGDPLGSPVNGTSWDAGSGAGVNNRNAATGAVAAHVFERPGTYTVALSVFDGTNTDTAETTITVDDPDVVFAGTNTVCVAASTTPVAGVNGCPAGASTAQQADFATLVSTYALTGNRVLLARGDTFVAPTTASIVNTGPGIVGAFGSGAAPIVQATSGTTILNLSSVYTADIKDWRIMDLDFDGLGTAQVGIDTQGGISQVLILHMNIHDIGNGVVLNSGIVEWWVSHGHPEHALFDDMAIVDSTMTPILGSTTGWRIFAAATRFSIQGNTLGNMTSNASMGSHVVRVTTMEKGVITNNTIARAGVTQLAIKLHAPIWCDVNSPAGTCVTPDNNAVMPPTYSYLTNTHPIGVFAPLSGYSELIMVSDNKIIGADNPWTISFGPQDPNNDERVRDVVIERNWFTAGSGTQIHMHLNCSATTVRNNVCDLTGGAYHECVDVSRWGGAQQVAPADVRVYNNTIYSGVAGVHVDFTGVAIDATATDVTVINNLGSAPFATDGPVMISGTGASGLVQSNNLLHNVPGDLFVNATPAVPADFHLIALPNPARDTGLSTVPVPSDFFGTSRPQNGSFDIGAVEGQ